jgi:hypothetical protein
VLRRTQAEVIARTLVLRVNRALYIALRRAHFSQLADRRRVILAVARPCSRHRDQRGARVRLLLSVQVLEPPDHDGSQPLDAFRPSRLDQLVEGVRQGGRVVKALRPVIQFAAITGWRDRIFASWNQLDRSLRQVEGLRRVA